jgi:hypothetical protein
VKLAPWRPWKPVEVNETPVVGPGYLNKADAIAIKAMAEGEATADQQKRALEAIIYRIACSDDLSYRADDHGGERDAAFAEGKRYVGLQIKKLIHTRLDILLGQDTPQKKAS